MSVRKVGDRRESLGYVMEEDGMGQNLVVLLENNERVCFETAPRIIEGIWDLGHVGRGYDQVNDDQQYEIIEFHPIRMKLFFSGWWHISYNQLRLRLDQPQLSIVPI